MLNAAVQNKGFPLAGLLSNVIVQDSAKYFAQFLTNPNGCSTENWSENLTKPDMRMTTNDDIAPDQLTGLMYANVKVRSVEVRSLNTTNCDINSTESLGEYLSKPDMQSAVAGGAEGFIGVTTGGTDLKLSGLLINSEGEFCQSIKKGSIAVATLLIHKQSAKLCFGHSSVLRRSNSLRATSTSCRISSPALVPISSTRARASRAEKRFDSALPSSWRRAISFLAAVTINPAILSPSFLINSIDSITSCGIRMFLSCDFVFTLPVAIIFPAVLLVCEQYNIQCVFKTLDIITHQKLESIHTLSTVREQVRHRNNNAPECLESLPRRLTTTDRACIEVAEMNITTHPQGRNNHTRGSETHLQSFIWIIAAVRRDCQTIKPVLHHIAAKSEGEARRALVHDHVCFFAGRLPVHGHGDMTTAQEVRHA